MKVIIMKIEKCKHCKDVLAVTDDGFCEMCSRGPWSDEYE